MFAAAVTNILITNESDVIITESWKKMEFNDLLRLLQPVEAQWDILGSYLVPDHEVEAIRANNFQSNAPDRAIFEAVLKWMRCTVREHRTWHALLSVAEKLGDNTGPQFLKDNGLKGEYLVVGHCHLITSYL